MKSKVISSFKSITDVEVESFLSNEEDYICIPIAPPYGRYVTRKILTIYGYSLINLNFKDFKQPIGKTLLQKSTPLFFDRLDTPDNFQDLFDGSHEIIITLPDKKILSYIEYWEDNSINFIEKSLWQNCKIDFEKELFSSICWFENHLKHDTFTRQHILAYLDLFDDYNNGLLK